MITDRLKELETLRAKVSSLEQAISGDLDAELKALPAKMGFADADSFIAAVQAATGKRRGRKPGSKNAVKKVEGKRTRSKITDDTRAEVKKMVEAEKTGAEIAKALKISLPSVQNIKKALGLVRKPKK
ncbi:MAG: helix-turn-helix domain-containing protein [Verrucomicrobiota bacterium]